MLLINTVRVWFPFFLTFHLILRVQEFLVQDKARSASSLWHTSWVCTHGSSSASHPAKSSPNPIRTEVCSYFLAKNIAGFGFQMLAPTKYCTKTHLMWTVNHSLPRYQEWLGKFETEFSINLSFFFFFLIRNSLQRKDSFRVSCLSPLCSKQKSLQEATRHI